jgi:tetratricopeptide (TPR) repeat protein
VGFFIACFLFCAPVAAQVNFVQITDPHLFDEDPEAVENKRALNECVKKINIEMAAGADYKFAVITGDIGIERIVKPLLEQKLKASPQAVVQRDQMIRNRLRGAALEVASLLAPTQIGIWLFVPGNNDLVDEEIDSLTYYRDFVSELRNALPGKEVIDLCPTDDLNSGIYTWGDGYLFIGFNNASFKNNNEAGRLSVSDNLAAVVSATTPSKTNRTEVTDEQINYVQQVLARVNRAGNRASYIFYHIPEIDDPHPVRNFNLDLLANRKLNSGDRYALSSWFVDGRVRELWNQVVVDNKVKGLFAGHLHDWRKDSYQNYRWLTTPNYAGGTLSKLYICPPLAIKRQEKEATQARGFQAVSIDGRGTPSVSIFWYDSANKTFSNPVEAQLAIGQLYENNGQLKEAETAYTKALDSDSTTVKNKASESLRRVINRNNSYRQKYFTSPLTAVLENGATIVITALLAMALIGAMAWVTSQYGKRAGRGKVEFVAFTDSTKDKVGANFVSIFEFVLGMMRFHFKDRGAMRGLLNLPVLARSQQAAIAEFAESTTPAGFGKAIAWATKGLHQAEYSVQGSVQSDGAALTVIVILRQYDDTVGTWSEIIALPVVAGGTSLLELQQRLAYKVLTFLRRHMNR